MDKNCKMSQINLIKKYLIQVAVERALIFIAVVAIN